MRLFVRSGARCQVSFQIYRVKRPLAKVRRTVAEIESFIFVHDGVVNLERTYFLVKVLE